MNSEHYSLVCLSKEEVVKPVFVLYAQFRLGWYLHQWLEFASVCMTAGEGGGEREGPMNLSQHSYLPGSILYHCITWEKVCLPINMR